MSHEWICFRDRHLASLCGYLCRNHYDKHPLVQNLAKNLKWFKFVQKYVWCWLQLFMNVTLPYFMMCIWDKSIKWVQKSANIYLSLISIQYIEDQSCRVIYAWQSSLNWFFCFLHIWYHFRNDLLNFEFLNAFQKWITTSEK